MQTSQVPPVGQAALRKPPEGPLGTPEPAACWRSCWTTIPVTPSFRLLVKTTGDGVIIVIMQFRGFTHRSAMAFLAKPRLGNTQTT